MSIDAAQAAITKTRARATRIENTVRSTGDDIGLIADAIEITGEVASEAVSTGTNTARAAQYYNEIINSSSHVPPRLIEEATRLNNAILNPAPIDAGIGFLTGNKATKAKLDRLAEIAKAARDLERYMTPSADDGDFEDSEPAVDEFGDTVSPRPSASSGIGRDFTNYDGNCPTITTGGIARRDRRGNRCGRRAASVRPGGFFS